MEAVIRDFALGAATLIDAATTVIIVLATVEAIVRVVVTFVTPSRRPGMRISELQPIRWRLGHWLSLALEVLIASDIIRTAVSSSWQQLGQLAAIVVVRSAINYSLMRDIRQAVVEGGANLRSTR